MNIGLVICVGQTLLALFVGNTDRMWTEGDVQPRHVDVISLVNTLSKFVNDLH